MKIYGCVTRKEEVRFCNIVISLEKVTYCVCDDLFQNVYVASLVSVNDQPSGYEIHMNTNGFPFELHDSLVQKPTPEIIKTMESLLFVFMIKSAGIENIDRNKCLLFLEDVQFPVVQDEKDSQDLGMILS